MTEYKLLKVDLSDEEKTEYLERLQKATTGLLRTEDKRQASAKEFTRKIHSFKKEIEDTNRAIEEGSEDREVEIDYRRNNDAGTIETIRLDTMEVINTRDMTEHEKNTDLFDDAENQGEPEENPEEAPAEA